MNEHMNDCSSIFYNILHEGQSVNRKRINFGKEIGVLCFLDQIVLYYEYLCVKREKSLYLKIQEASS